LLQGGDCMKRSVLMLVILLASCYVQARGLTAQEATCLSQIKDETDFIISRINLIHHDYEHQLKQTSLGKFKSGDYSTIGLLDNTIRKYHRKLVKRLKGYPFRYQARIKGSSPKASKACLAERLRNESVGTIHEFELSWQKVLQEAEKNASYFQQIDGIQ